MTGLQALYMRLKPAPGSRRPPNMAGLVAGILNTNYAYRSHFVESNADLILRLPTNKWGLLDFDDWAEIAEVGYQAACEQLVPWLARRQEWE